MLTIDRILLPVDFSRQNIAAARQAATLARHFDAHLTLLHVNAHFVPGVSLASEIAPLVDPDWVSALETQRRQELADWLPEVFEGLDLTCQVITGDPAGCIVDYAKEHRIDLIVMATHGYGGFRAFLLGSVVSKVLNDASCPVLTGAHLAEGPTHEIHNFSNVLAAIDNGPASPRVIQFAQSYADEFRAPFSLVHAIPQFEVIEGFDDPALHRSRIRAADISIRSLLQSTAAGPTEVAIREGEPAKVVAHEALHADVLVIGRSPCRRERLRTHAYAIIREAPCPVISI